jgi:hypothetical protein
MPPRSRELSPAQISALRALASNATAFPAAPAAAVIECGATLRHSTARSLVRLGLARGVYERFATPASAADGVALVAVGATQAGIALVANLGAR